MSKQMKHVCRKDIEEEGKKEYVTCVPDFLVPNSIPNKIQLYFLLQLSLTLPIVSLYYPQHLFYLSQFKWVSI